MQHLPGINVNQIGDISDMLITLMLEKFPGAGYTIWINFWMDSTFQVKCVSGDENHLLRIFKWYDGEITYEEQQV